jgi:hypothetical protein
LNIRPDGYITVILYKNYKIKALRVHRLVAEAFIPNPDNLPEVNHKDENPMNNEVSNLEWCNRSYNINYRFSKQQMYEQKRYSCKVCRNSVRFIRPQEKLLGKMVLV